MVQVHPGGLDWSVMEIDYRSDEFKEYFDGAWEFVHLKYLHAPCFYDILDGFEYTVAAALKSIKSDKIMESKHRIQKFVNLYVAMDIRKIFKIEPWDNSILDSKPS